MISKPDYSQCAEYYDAAHETGAEVTSHSNHSIEKILRKYKVKAVLDLTCGTGMQVFWLVKRGYQVVGSDISPEMLKVAKSKAKKENIKIKFLKGDMCTIKIGRFDAAITIFNSIGHLNKARFEKAMRNIHRNLNDNGLYIFDIFNTNMSHQLEDSLKVDAITTVGNIKIHKIQRSKINKRTGVMTVTEEEHRQVGPAQPIIRKRKSTLQTYTTQWLSDMLTRNGFKVLKQVGPNGSKLSEKNSISILTIARKVDK